MSYDPLHDMILAETTPTVIVSYTDDYRGNITRVFRVNAMVSNAVLTSARLVDGKLYSRDNVRASRLAEGLMNSLMAIPGVTSVVLGAPSSFSLQVTKRYEVFWDEMQRDVLTFFCLLFEGWMDERVILIDPSKAPLGADVTEFNFYETEIDPTALF